MRPANKSAVLTPDVLANAYRQHHDEQHSWESISRELGVSRSLLRLALTQAGYDMSVRLPTGGSISAIRARQINENMHGFNPISQDYLQRKLM